MHTPHSSNPPTLLGVDARLGSYQLKLLALPDVAAILSLRGEVLDQLEHPDLYVREEDEPAFVRSHVAGHPACIGDTIGMFDGDQLIAYAMLGLPETQADSLARYLQLPGRSLGDVAQLTSCMVLPSYRGRGLQRTLLRARFSLARAYGRTVCVAMVSLHNHASRLNLLRSGLRVLHVGVVDGLQRQLMVIDFERGWQCYADQARLVGCEDFLTQSELTRAGWLGVSEIGGDGTSQMVFGRIATRNVHASPR